MVVEAAEAAAAETLETLASTRGALKGIIRVLSIDGQISVVAAAMLGRADVWNAMVR